jgi:hypothetical protein
MNQPSEKPGFWRIVLSTFAAAFGVQNRKNLEQDFKYGSIYVYVAAGIIFTSLFILTVIMVVRMVMKSNGL